MAQCVEVEWGGTWWPAEVLNVQGGKSYVHYTGWADSWNEWVTPDRVRPGGLRSDELEPPRFE